MNQTTIPTWLLNILCIILIPAGFGVGAIVTFIKDIMTGKRKFRNPYKEIRELKKHFYTITLLKTLIAHYQRTLNNIEAADELNNLISIRLIILNSKTQYGICFCAWEFFKDKTLCTSHWIQSNIVINGHWCCTPNECKTKEETIDTFRFRIDKMKEVLEEKLYLND